MRVREESDRPMSEPSSNTLPWDGRMGRDRPVSDEDAALVARATGGDRSAFDELYARYEDYVFNIVCGIVGNPSEAGDVTQDVFLHAYHGLASFRRGSRFATWLFRIAVNRALDYVRSKRRRGWFSLDAVARFRSDPSPGPESVALSQSDREVVQAILMQLPVNHREVLVLRYYQDLTVDEIAEVMGCSVPAAKVRLHRARLAFRTLCEKCGWRGGPQ